MYERSASNTDLEVAMLNAGGAAVDLYSGEAGGYSPTFMLVATYEEIPPDPSAVTTNEVGACTRRQCLWGLSLIHI